MRSVDSTTPSNDRSKSVNVVDGPFAMFPEWIADLDISDRGSKLYVFLALYADPEGYSWPSRQTLARRLRCGLNSVDRAISELVSLKVLRVESRVGTDGGQTSNGYRIRRSKPAYVQPPLPTGGEPPLATGEDPPLPTGGALTIPITNYTHLELIAFGTKAEKPAAPRKVDLIWEAVLDVCGINPIAITKSSRGAYNRATADLREVGASPKTIAIRATVFRRRWPEVSLTPTALARRWPECDPDTQHGKRAPLLASERSELSALVDAWETK